MDDAQMLLRSLKVEGRSMTAKQLENHWHPTWSEEQIQSMLKQLVTSGEVLTEHGTLMRYRVALPIAEHVG